MRVRRRSRAGDHAARPAAPRRPEPPQRPARLVRAGRWRHSVEPSLRWSPAGTHRRTGSPSIRDS